VGLIFDLAVAALALLVVGSLALLAWTLGFSAVREARRGRRQVAELRRDVVEAETRLRSGAATATATIAELTARTTPPKPGDGPDA
jgi:hypothetical protein